VINFDDEKQRIQLGLKQLNAHPWDALEPSKLAGKVKRRTKNAQR
jgi:small subunit ribosomal protein S1